MTWMKMSTTTMETREMRLDKLQLVIDEQSQMRIKTGQLENSGEAKTARSLRTPEPPTDAARMALNATHVPFRDWCPICGCESWTKFSAQTSCGEQDLTKEILRHLEAYGFLNPVIIQCDKEMSIIDVCRSCTGTRRGNSVTICAKNKSSEQWFCRSNTRTHTGTRTMLPDAN